MSAQADQNQPRSNETPVRAGSYGATPSAPENAAAPQGVSGNALNGAAHPDDAAQKASEDRAASSLDSPLTRGRQDASAAARADGASMESARENAAAHESDCAENGALPREDEEPAGPCVQNTASGATGDFAADNSGERGEDLPAQGGNTEDTNGSTEEAKQEEGEDDLQDDRPMSLTDHLTELRTRIVRMLTGAAVGFFLCYGVAEELFRYLSLPLVKVMPPDTRLIYTSVPEGFFVYLKVALVAGIFLASPYIFYQLWAFIAPGLYKEERRMIFPLSLFSAIFFLLGAGFCYWGVFPFAFTFFMSYSTGIIVAMPSLNEYLGFALKMLLAFGLIFEMPLFAFFLSRLGIITPEWMRKVRRYAILAVFIVAAILTPPDVFSQLLMAGPMLILYELSIFVAALARKRKPKENAEDEKKGSPQETNTQSASANTQAPSKDAQNTPEKASAEQEKQGEKMDPEPNEPAAPRARQ